jgi:hypothetical protein
MCESAERPDLFDLAVRDEQPVPAARRDQDSVVAARPAGSRDERPAVDSLEAEGDVRLREDVVGVDRGAVAAARPRQGLLEAEQAGGDCESKESASDERNRGAAKQTLAPGVSVVGAWALSRLLVFGVALAVQFFGWPSHFRPGLAHHPFALLGVWDGRWYRMIATRGYFLLPGHPGPGAFFPQSDPAFFPLLPLGLRGLHALGLPLNIAGFLLSNLGFLIGLLALERVGRSFLPADEARRAAVYAALFPFSFVFSMVYPEGLVFAAIALAYLLAVRERWFASAAFAALAAIGRPQGLFLLLPLAALARSRWRSLSPRSRSGAVAAILAPPAALASFSLYLWQEEGDPLAWSKAEHGWQRSFSFSGPMHALRQLVLTPHKGEEWLARDAIFLCLYLVALLIAARAGIPRSWIAAALLMLALPIASGSLTSEARFGLLALPVFWGLAIAGRRRPIDRAITIASPILLATATATILLRWP